MGAWNMFPNVTSFPDTGAFWISNVSNADTVQPPVSLVTMARTVIVQSSISITIFAYAKTDSTIFINGSQVGSLVAKTQSTFQSQLYQGVNYIQVVTQSAGFLATIIDSSNNVIVHTDNTWISLSSPSQLVSNANASLVTNQYLQSPDGQTIFTLQWDGNLCVYHSPWATLSTDIFTRQNLLYSAGTWWYPGWVPNTPASVVFSTLTVLQTGDLVLFDESSNIKWHTSTSTSSPPVTLSLLDSGTLVLTDASGATLWHT
jgi:hypothetical protein